MITNKLALISVCYFEKSYAAVLLLLFYLTLIRFIFFYCYTYVVTVEWKNHLKEPLSPWSLCHESATLLYLYPVRQHSIEHAGTSTEKPRRSIAWRLRPLARISLWQLRGTYRIVRISNHLFNIASPVIGDLVVKRGAFSTHRRAGMRSTRGRQRASTFTLFFSRAFRPVFIH